MLTESQIQQFQNDGFLVVEDLLDEELLADIKSEYKQKLTQLCHEWASQNQLSAEVAAHSFDQQLLEIINAGLDYFQPLDISWPIGDFSNDTPIHLGESVFRMIRNKRTLDVVESLIGSEITSTPIQHVCIKPPLTEVAKGENRAHIIGTDWHQDRAVAQSQADRTQMVTVWMAITDATIDNGCLQVVPGSHKEIMHTHCPASQIGIPPTQFDVDKATPLPVKAGGAILFHPLTIHGSRENHSDAIRWSFDLRYNVTGEPTGRSQFPEFIARSKKSPDAELHSHQQWAASWMATKDELAGQSQDPLAYHRWDGSGAVCA